jgi:dimethylsulfoniopropionate demethylase
MPELSISRRTRSTPFTSRLTEAGVKGYTVYNHMLLPTVFRSVEEDYYHLCQHVQVWDVSCERQVQIQGPDANKLVQWMTPRDISQAQDDQCFYLPLCDEHGILINDPIGIKVDEQTWWLSIADSDVLLWAKGLALGAGLDVRITEPNVWPVAIQGPKAEVLVERLFGEGVRNIRFFRYQRLAFRGHEMIVARSGWSKQGGFEVYVDDAEVGQAMWDELFLQGEDLNVGHGSPNLIERIESGLLSFGSDMDYRHTPLQCGLDKYCHLDRDLPSMSLEALRQQKAEGVPSRLIGLAAPQMHQLPVDMKVRLEGSIVGEITSHTLSAKYHAWLGFAMLNSAAIRAALEENRRLTVKSGNVEYQVICCELPYDFAKLNLAERNT